MLRPMLLVFLLIGLIITSQFEWKQPLVTDKDTTPSASEKQLRVSERQEAVKEKIILSQGKSIQDLKNLVRNLQEQLKLCGASKQTSNDTSGISMDDNFIEIKRTDVMHD